MKAFVLKIAVAGVRALAAIAGLFASRNSDIVLISCQGNKPTQDLLDLATELRRNLGVPIGQTTHGKVRNLDAPYIRVIAGKMKRNPGGALLFIGKMFSMLRLIARAKVVVIDTYCPAVSIPKKRPNQKVVQIWHAPEAIKKFSLQIIDTPAGYSRKTADILRMHRNYDYILCPADATRPFFEEAFGYPEDAFVKLGLPSLDKIGYMKRPMPGELEGPERIEKRKAIYEKYPALTDRPLTVVYAPTFRDDAPLDVEGLVRAFTKHDGIKLVLKLHPLDNEYKGHSSVINDKEFPLIDWYAAADAIITDYSGVAVEAAAAGIASYYYIYDIDDYKARRGLNVDLREEAVSKYAFIDAEELAAKVIDNRTYDYEALSVFTDKYLEVPLSGNTQELTKFLEKIYKKY